MTKTTIESIINTLPSKYYVYGFRLRSGQELIITSGIFSPTPHKNIEYELSDIALIIHTRTSTPQGPQSRVARYIDYDTIAEVVVFETMPS